MEISEFKLERYFAKYEFSAPNLLCCSDCEPMKTRDVLTRSEFRELKNLWLGYTESQGDPSLRKEISELYEKVHPEDILVCAPEEGIFIAMNLLLEKGDKVIVQEPGYQSLYEIAKSVGCNVVPWRPTKTDGWEWDLKFLEENEGTKLIVINTPHNPTGHHFSKKEFHKIMEIAKQNNAYVFCDEMYRLLEHDEKYRLKSGSDIYKKCISLFGMSKTFGLAGLRIGWLCIREPELLKKAQSFKDYTTICSSAPSEFIATRALQKKEKIIERNLKIINSNLKLLDNFFDRHNEFSWIKPKAGPITFAEMKTDNIEDVAKDLVEKKGVMILPSTQYNYDNKHFRIGFGRKDMAGSLRLFEEYIDEV